jgi:hypothetical protein
MDAFRRSLLAAVSLVILPAAELLGANMLLTVEYAGSYDSAFMPLPGSPPAPLFAENAPHSGAFNAIPVPGAYHRFDVYMTITGLPPGEDFQTVQWDMVLGPGVTPSDVGYVAVAPPYMWDTPGPIGPRPLFSQNGDAGANTMDLERITVIANPSTSHAGTHLRHPGENEPGGVGSNANLAPPTKLGSAYVFWDGSVGPDGKSFVGVAPNGANPWTSITSTNTPVGHTQAEFTSGPRSEWATLVEPFICDDLFPGGCTPPGGLVVAGPLPTNDNDNPDAGITWFLESVTGPDGPVVGATVNPATGVFTWQTQPTTKRGFYNAVIRGTNDDTPLGTDTGNLTFVICIPEPATLLLLGGAMCCIRCRVRFRPG